MLLYYFLQEVSVRIPSIAMAALLLPTLAYGAQPEEAAQPGGEADAPTSIQGTAIPPDSIVTGTSLNPSGTSHQVFDVDAASGVATPLASDVPVWGATYDAANGRVLFTSSIGTSVGGAALWEIEVATGTMTQVGEIRDAAGAPFRIDGLAISNGTLYGSRAAASSDGLYSIDMNTLVVTLVFPFADSISGIDADPATGFIYGVDDSTTQLVRIDLGGPSIVPVAPYPDVNETDIDGLAIGNGRAYLIPDDNSPNLIYVYNIGTGMYETPLPAPWSASDTFSGGAYVPTSYVPPLTQEIPTLSPLGLTALVASLALAAGLLFRRRRQAG